MRRRVGVARGQRSRGSRARRRVNAPHAVAPGDQIENHVRGRASAAPREDTSAARMVHEGVDSCGRAVSAAVTLTVGGGESDDTNDSDTDEVHEASGRTRAPTHHTRAS